METLAFLLEANSLELRKHSLLNLYFTGFHDYWFQYYDLFVLRGKKKYYFQFRLKDRNPKTYPSGYD